MDFVPSNFEVLRTLRSIRHMLFNYSWCDTLRVLAAWRDSGQRGGGIYVATLCDGV
jgi:hypothetical protein